MNRRVSFYPLAFLLIISALLISGISLAQTETKITPDDGAAIDHFGFSASIDGDYAVVGAQYDDDNGNSSGSVYIFYREGSNWTQQTKLTADNGAAYDCFGCSVSISGDYAVIGANGDDDNGSGSGSAYIFHREGNSWTQQANLMAGDGAAGDEFGRSVSISGDYAVIGAHGDDDNGYWSGSAYIFHRDGESWTQQAKLTADDGANYDYFGLSVSICGDYAVIGTRDDDDAGDDSGSAYIFVRDGVDWTQQAKLTASDGAEADYFSLLSVSISGDYAIIGAYGDDDNGSESGSAYIFHHDGESWTQEAKLTSDDGAAGDYFGLPVSISGDYAVIGAYCDDDNGSESGSAYIFHRDGESWTQQAKLTASDGAEADYFSLLSVSISGDYAVIGAYGDDDNGNYSGSAYIYDLSPSIEDMIAELIDEINDLVDDGVLNRGQGNALRVKLNNALRSIERGNERAAINQLGAFINQVNAFIRAEIFTEEQGQPLIDAVNAIIECLSEEGDALDELLLTIGEYLPDYFTLYEAYPNPFNSTTTIGYCLPFESPVSLTVYDVSGHRVATLIDGYQQPGIHNAVLDSDNLATGMYIVRLEAGGRVFTQKVMLVR